MLRHPPSAPPFWSSPTELYGREGIVYTRRGYQWHYETTTVRAWCGQALIEKISNCQHEVTPTPRVAHPQGNTSQRMISAAQGK